MIPWGISPAQRFLGAVLSGVLLASVIGLGRPASSARAEEGGGQGPAAAGDRYICACATGADGNCAAGSDGNAGTSASSPWATYEKARTAFPGLPAGSAVRFCRGGAVNVSGESDWYNYNCTAGQPCQIADYTPPWASGDEGAPIVRVVNGQRAFTLNNPGAPAPDGGYTLRNLDLRCATSGGCDDGILLYDDVDDVRLDGLRVDGFYIGVHHGTAGECPAATPGCNRSNDRLSVRNAVILNSDWAGFYGGGNDLLIENSYFENNGTLGTTDNHNIYVRRGSGITIRGNTLYRAALDSQGDCNSISLVGHGTMDNLLIEGNLVYEDAGKANNSCWGISVDTGYTDTAERFSDVTIRGNQVINVGTLGIGLNACVNCTVENNLVTLTTVTGAKGIGVPSKARGTGDAESANILIRNNSIYIASSGFGIRLKTEGNGHRIFSNAIQYAGSTSWNCFDLDLDVNRYLAVDYNVCGYSAGEWLDGAGQLAAARARGWDLNSLAAAPGFTSPADLRPASNAAAMVGAGHPTLSTASDYAGRPRDSDPDAGAYEWGTSNPVAQADTFFVLRDANHTQPAPGVLGNDWDPDRQPLTAVKHSNPAAGSLTLNGNGSFTYTPPAGFTGTVTFGYVATDGVLSSATATVTLLVVDEIHQAFLPIVRR